MQLKSKMKFSFLLLFIVFQEAVSELISAGLAIGAVITYLYKDDLKHFAAKVTDIASCSSPLGDYVECCGKPWINPNIQGLIDDLQQNVYGQNIVLSEVSSSLAAHISKAQPKKPLVLSFHGWTGGGKNYVTSFIAKNFYKRGEKSQFYHYINSRIHFPRVTEVESYQEELRNWIFHNVSLCPYNMFVFDEVDDMPPKVLDGIKPFLDHHKQIDGVDFRHTIFIFISNVGGNIITERYLDLWRRDGKTRENMELRDYENVIGKTAFNQEGGFYLSNVIDHNLIDHFVPFLPLEKHHVKECITAELRKLEVHNPSEDIISEVIGTLNWGPKPEELFSTSGCKGVNKVGTIVFREKLRFGKSDKLNKDGDGD